MLNPIFSDDRSLGVKADLDYVRQVISSEYAVVGTMENLEETLDVLEAKVPQFFKGIKEIYKAKSRWFQHKNGTYYQANCSIPLCRDQIDGTRLAQI